jgi:hypothetical protein
MMARRFEVPMDDSRDRARRALDELEREVRRAVHLIEELRLENAALRRQIKSRHGAPIEAVLAASGSEGGDDERQRWASERHAVVERLKTILGRFQWLEGGAL